MMIGLIGDGQTVTRRPESASQPKSMQDAQPIAIKQLMWDEANTIYELDDPPVQETTKKRTKQPPAAIK